jgi:hypothetical protein
MESNRAFTIPFVLSLIGGIIVLLFSLVYSVWFSSAAPNWGGFGGWMGGMMGNYHGFMGNYAGSTGFMAGVSIVGLVSGMIMIISAVMLRVHPGEHLIWGTVIIVFSATSFLGMGGFFIGAILGIIGGALALSFKPEPTKR